MSSRRLERSATNRVIAGVCGGIAEYLDIDPTVVRVFFVIATIFTAGLGVLAYIVLLILMPLPGQPPPFVSPSRDSGAAATAGPTAEGAPASAPLVTTPADPVARAAETERRRAAFGYLLIALGVAFFLGNVGLFRVIQWQLVWPLVLVALGALLVVQRLRP